MVIRSENCIPLNRLKIAIFAESGIAAALIFSDKVFPPPQNCDFRREWNVY